MAQLNVNPTRMELARMKKGLGAAVRGHKLLKDRRDETMRQFLEIVKRSRQLRKSVEKTLFEANLHMVTAEALLGREVIYEALIGAGRSFEVKVGMKNIMGAEVPSFDVPNTKNASGGALYGYVFTSSELDRGAELFRSAAADLFKLAECEKAAGLLSEEIERTRRRVNALEYVLIPNYRDTAKYIAMKLEENERGSIVRLMKVKEITER